MLEHKRLWVFDLDGTLTRPVHDFMAIRRELGIPEQEDIIAYLDQLPEPESRLRHRRLAQIERDLAGDSEAGDGVVECLQWLAQRAELGLLTRNTRENALLSLEAIGLSRLFATQAILGRECAAPKPSPEGIVQLMSLSQVVVADTVMVGDFVHDLEAGRAAGVTTVHVDFRGRFDWNELADHSFHNFVELHEFLVK
ncbi:HAD family hydrolase [Aestuariirhabdus sp. Z084]|uniref:HAD family hydrolase n=1 Tax=Aestuariirhabdus haliotis TaxID=2918751 RepID=UPI00201B387E|nr:HAD family hydrolase [Aestuariirhabdus haliotis]MCL6416986.1 HAD family hydrolase [Aestuariirhabdus haliotis]MCL6421007.1 HAD family hydrolase [Aestuariirhabdus haliotis]